MAIMMAITTTISWMISLFSADDIFLINQALKELSNIYAWRRE